MLENLFGNSVIEKILFFFLKMRKHTALSLVMSLKFHYLASRQL